MESIPEKTSETRAQGRGTILIVEDEPLMLRLLVKVFSRHGYQVLAVSDGEQAIEAYRRNKPSIDIVLLDMGLPKIGGQEVFRRLKEENMNVRIVIASGYLEPKLKSQLELAGVTGFLSKPYHLDELSQTIQRLIEER